MRNWSALYRSPVVRRHMNGPLQRTAKEWWIGCERNAGLAEQQLSVVLSSSNDFVGVCGFLQSRENREWELYLVLRQKYWRKGLATELAKTLITIAFDSLGARRVVGIIDPENQSSLKMVEKLGFRFMRKHSKPGHWQDGHFFYGIENKNA